jgi:hypothetical protein
MVSCDFKVFKSGQNAKKSNYQILIIFYKTFKFKLAFFDISSLNSIKNYSVPFFEFFSLIVNVINQTAISLNIQIKNRSIGKNIFDVWFFYNPINVKWLPMMPNGIAEYEWVTEHKIYAKIGFLFELEILLRLFNFSRLVYLGATIVQVHLHLIHSSTL